MTPLFCIGDLFCVESIWALIGGSLGFFIVAWMLWEGIKLERGISSVFWHRPDESEDRNGRKK